MTPQTYHVRRAGNAAILGIWAVTVLQVIDSVLHLFAVRLAVAARDGRDVGLINQAGALLQPLVFWFGLAMFLSAIMVMLLWCYRVRRNLDVIPGAAPRYRPFWSLGGWLIPGANFVVPVLVMDDIARNTEPAAMGLRRLVWAWWAAFLGAEVGGFVAAYLEARAPQPPGSFTGPAGFQQYVDYFEGAFYRGLPLAILFVVAAVLISIVIRRISRTQEAQLAAVRKAWA